MASRIGRVSDERVHEMHLAALASLERSQLNVGVRLHRLRVVNSRTRLIINRRTPTRSLLMLLAPLPAVAVGVIVMKGNGVNPAIWGQQLAGGLILMLLSVVVGVARRPAPKPRPWARAFVGSAALLLLVATLVQPGVEGVRRWVALGPLQLHAAFVAVPVLIIVLGSVVGDVPRRASWTIPAAAAVAAGVLVLQPDASQAFAFAVAVFIVLFRRRHSHWSDWTAAAIVVGSAFLALSRPDPLDTVLHVEGIVGLAADAGTAWLIAAVLALALLPVPFLSEAARRDGGRGGMALAAYFGIACIASFLAPYPVPILGFGLSPLLGYFVALGWFVADRPTDAETDSTIHRAQVA